LNDPNFQSAHYVLDIFLFADLKKADAIFLRYQDPAVTSGFAAPAHECAVALA
jgi:hypothetical protein